MPFRLGKISELATNYYMDSSEGCINCHSSKEKIAEFGYPQFYVTLEDVRKQSGHKTVSCRDCLRKEKVHKGMLKPIFVIEDVEYVERTT